MANKPTTKLDVTRLDSTVQYFCSKGIADSSQRTYQSGLHKFATFCSTYVCNYNPLPSIRRYSLLLRIISKSARPGTTDIKSISSRDPSYANLYRPSRPEGVFFNALAQASPVRNPTSHLRAADKNSEDYLHT